MQLNCSLSLKTKTEKQESLILLNVCCLHLSLLVCFFIPSAQPGWTKTRREKGIKCILVSSHHYSKCLLIPSQQPHSSLSIRQVKGILQGSLGVLILLNKTNKEKGQDTGLNRLKFEDLTCGQSWAHPDEKDCEESSQIPLVSGP